MKPLAGFRSRTEQLACGFLFCCLCAHSLSARSQGQNPATQALQQVADKAIKNALANHETPEQALQDALNAVVTADLNATYEGQTAEENSVQAAAVANGIAVPPSATPEQAAVIQYGISIANHKTPEQAAQDALGAAVYADQDLNRARDIAAGQAAAVIYNATQSGSGTNIQFTPNAALSHSFAPVDFPSLPPGESSVRSEYDGSLITIDPAGNTFHWYIDSHGSLQVEALVIVGSGPAPLAGATPSGGSSAPAQGTGNSQKSNANQATTGGSTRLTPAEVAKEEKSAAAQSSHASPPYLEFKFGEFKIGDISPAPTPSAMGAQQAGGTSPSPQGGTRSNTGPIGVPDFGKPQLDTTELLGGSPQAKLDCPDPACDLIYEDYLKAWQKYQAAIFNQRHNEALSPTELADTREAQRVLWIAYQDCVHSCQSQSAAASGTTSPSAPAGTCLTFLSPSISGQGTDIGISCIPKLPDSAQPGVTAPNNFSFTLTLNQPFIGVPMIQVAQPETPSTEVSNNPPNVFTGTVNGNSVTFYGMPDQRPLTSGFSHSIRIINIRPNANGAAPLQVRLTSPTFQFRPFVLTIPSASGDSVSNGQPGGGSGLAPATETGQQGGAGGDAGPLHITVTVPPNIGAKTNDAATQGQTQASTTDGIVQELDRNTLLVYGHKIHLTALYGSRVLPNGSVNVYGIEGDSLSAYWHSINITKNPDGSVTVQDNSSDYRKSSTPENTYTTTTTYNGPRTDTITSSGQHTITIQGTNGSLVINILDPKTALQVSHNASSSVFIVSETTKQPNGNSTGQSNTVVVPPATSLGSSLNQEIQEIINDFTSRNQTAASPNNTPGNPSASENPSTDQRPSNNTPENPSNTSLDTSAFNDEKALEEHLKDVGKTPDDAAIEKDIMDQVEKSLGVPSSGTAPGANPASPTPQTSPGTTQSSAIPSTSPTSTTNVAVASNCGAGQICGGANGAQQPCQPGADCGGNACGPGQVCTGPIQPCQPGQNCDGTGACGPGKVCTPEPCQNATDCGNTCGPGQTCTGGNGNEQPVPEIRAADPVIEVMGALASKPRAAKPGSSKAVNAAEKAAGNAVNKANEINAPTPSKQVGAAIDANPNPGPAPTPASLSLPGIAPAPANGAEAKPGSTEPQPMNTETTPVEYRAGPGGPSIVRQVTQQPPNAQNPPPTAPAPAPGSAPAGAAPGTTPKIDMGGAKAGFSEVQVAETETPPVDYRAGPTGSKTGSSNTANPTGTGTGGATNKKNETKISTPPMQSGAAAGPGKGPTGKGIIPGGGGSSSGDPAPPEAPPIPPPPSSSPAPSVPLVPRKALPQCWPAGTDTKAACQTWFDIAQKNQVAATLAAQAVTSAQNDANQAAALDAAAQAWSDYSQNLTAFSSFYSARSAEYSANIAGAASDQSAAQWQQLAADAAQKSKDFSDQSTAATAQAQKIKQQADDLRAKLEAAKADQTAKEAAAAASWADYQACLSLQVCPPEEKPLNSIGGGNPIGNPPSNGGSNGQNVIEGGTGGLGGLLGSLFGGLGGLNALNNNLFGNAPGAPAVQNIVVTINVNYGSPAPTDAPATTSGSLHISPQRTPTPHSGSTAQRPRFKLVVYHSGSPSRAPSPGRRIADRSPSKFSPLPSTEGPAFSIVASGNLGTNALEFRVHDPTGRLKGNIALPEGMVLEPLKASVRNPVNAASGENTLSQQLTAYCLDMAKLPPDPGQLYRLASPAVQEKYKPVKAVLQAGAKLAAAGQLHPDSDAAAYADFVRQHALWAELEHWTEQKFTEVFLERTRKNAEHLNVKWTNEMTDALRAAAPGRWRDIAMVLEEAHKLRGTAGAP